jgi:hypothetical protein
MRPLNVALRLGREHAREHHGAFRVRAACRASRLRGRWIAHTGVVVARGPARASRAPAPTTALAILSRPGGMRPGSTRSAGGHSRECVRSLRGVPGTQASRRRLLLRCVPRRSQPRAGR